jgi:hypothetical protein
VYEEICGVGHHNGTESPVSHTARAATRGR